jgi:hypothetical protein
MRGLGRDSRLEFWTQLRHGYWWSQAEINQSQLLRFIIFHILLHFKLTGIGQGLEVGADLEQPSVATFDASQPIAMVSQKTSPDAHFYGFH